MTIVAAEQGRPSQTMKAQLAIRELILSGELKPGDRISELSAVDRFGISRTPIRMALVRLEEEGLLEAIPSGGFAVKAFSETDIHDAIEVRGTLEGLAVRLAAERGISASLLSELHSCLGKLDALVGHATLTMDDFADYVALNARFHSLLVAAAESPVLTRQIERVVNLPFASASGFVMVQAALPETRYILTVAQDQHRCVLRAIEEREGARAEALMCEHARVARRNLQLALQDQGTRSLVPGSVLIGRRAAFQAL